MKVYVITRTKVDDYYGNTVEIMAVKYFLDTAKEMVSANNASSPENIVYDYEEFELD